MSGTNDFRERIAASTPDELAAMARMLLDHPLLAVVLDEIEQDAINTWVTSEQVNVREEQWHKRRAVESLRANLQQRLNNKAIIDRQPPGAIARRRPR